MSVQAGQGEDTPTRQKNPHRDIHTPPIEETAV